MSDIQRFWIDTTSFDFNVFNYKEQMFILLFQYFDQEIIIYEKLISNNLLN